MITRGFSLFSLLCLLSLYSFSSPRFAFVLHACAPRASLAALARALRAPYHFKSILKLSLQCFRVPRPPWSDLGSTWPSWPSWNRLGIILDASWGHLGAILGRLGRVLGRLVAVLGRLVAVLASQKPPKIDLKIDQKIDRKSIHLGVRLGGVRGAKIMENVERAAPKKT